MNRNERRYRIKEGLFLNGTLVLLLALCVLILGGCFWGIRIQPLRAQAALEVAADSALYVPGISLDPAELYNRAMKQTVFLSWTKTDADGKVLKSSSGAGIVLTQDGYILTNAHCVSEAKTDGVEVTVELSDGQTFPAKILGADSDTDVALIKIEAYGLTPAAIASQRSVQPCQPVYVMGHPDQELKFTMTSGIVSALDREITFSDGTTLSMFQVDAAVNPGNSGGPVYNAQGYIVGMTTAKYVNLPTEGIGFAIPAEAAVKIAEELKLYGFVRNRPLLGVTVQNALEGDVAEGSPAGARVYSVEEGLPGAKAGLQKDDIITAMGKKEITSMQDLLDAKKDYHAFETVKLTVWRSGVLLQLRLTFDEVTPEHPTGTVEVEPEESEAPAEGLPPEEDQAALPETFPGAAQND